MTHKSKIKELVGRGLNSYHSKALKQIDRIEKKNKEQNYKIGNLVNELDNDYITKAEEGSVISLEHSKEGMVYIDELEGNTLVNYCADGAKELTLNDEIDTEGINVTLNNTIDNGIVDVSLEGNTMVNVCDQKEPVAITKSYTVEDSGNHIPLQGEYNGKCRPNLYGQTMVNVCSQKDPVAITKSYTVENSGNHIALQGEYDGKCRPVVHGNTLVNLCSKETTHTSAPHLNSSNYKDYTIRSDIKLNTPNIIFALNRDIVSNGVYTLKISTQAPNECYQVSIRLRDVNANVSHDIKTYNTTSNKSIDDTVSFSPNSSFTPSIGCGFQIIYYFDSAENAQGKTLIIEPPMLFEGDLTQTPNLIPNGYVEGLKSSFENNEEPANANIFKNEGFYNARFVGSVNSSYYYNTYSTTSSNTPELRCTSLNLTKLIPNTNYTVSLIDTSLSVAIHYYNKDYLLIGETGWLSDNPATFTTHKDAVYGVVYLCKIDGSTISPNECVGIQLELGNASTTYVDYTPKYKVEYKVTGKNKYNKDKYPFGDGYSLANSSTNVEGFDEVTSRSVMFKLLPNTTYTYSADLTLDSNVGSAELFVLLYDNSNVMTSVNSIGILSTGRYSITFSTDSVGVYCELRFDNNFSKTGNEGIVTIDNIQLEEGSTATPYESFKEFTKTFYLNSPLLEGDTIEDINGKATHVKRSGQAILNGSEDWTMYPLKEEYPDAVGFYTPIGVNAVKDGISGVSDRFKALQRDLAGLLNTNDEGYVTSGNPEGGMDFHKISIFKYRLSTQDVNGFKQWLQANPVTVVYQLASPKYETISEESILCDSYVNGHLDFDSAVPVKQIYFKHFDIPLPYSQPNTVYTVQFNADNAGILYNLDVSGGKIKNTNVAKGSNKFTLTTPNEILYSWFTMSGIGFNVSNISVVATDKEFDYFEGLSSSFEDQLVTDVNDPNYGKYKVEYKVTGKNKLADKYKVEGYLGGGYEDNKLMVNLWKGSDAVSFIIPCKPNTTYTLNNHYGDRGVLACFSSYPQNLTQVYGTITGKITTTSDAKWLMVYVNSSFTDKDLICQLEEGEVATEYEPYKEYTKTFYLSSPLLEGDSIENVNGKATHVKRYNRVILDGVVCDEVTKYALSGLNDDVSTGLAFYVYTTKKPAITGNDLDMTGVYSDNFKNINPYDAVTPPFNKHGVSLHKSVNELRFVIAKNVLNEPTLDGVKQWLQKNPTTVVYKLSTPIYETISNEPILCDSYVGGHLDFNSAVPVGKVEFAQAHFPLKYIQPNTNYTIQFESDNVGKVEMAMGGSTVWYTNVNKGINKFNLTTKETWGTQALWTVGEGFNASNIQVVATDKEFGYFEGMKSVGECEDNRVEILSQNKNLFNPNEVYQSSYSFGVPTVNTSSKCNAIDGVFSRTTTQNSWNLGIGFHIKVEKNTDYILTVGEFFNDGVNMELKGFGVYKSEYPFTLGVRDTSYEHRLVTERLDANNNSLKFNSKNYDYILFYIGGQWNKDANGVKNFRMSKIEVNKSSVKPTVYTEPRLNKKEIPLNEPLRALPNGVKDKIVKIGGKWYVERNCGEVVLDGNSTENFSYVKDNGGDMGIPYFAILKTSVPLEQKTQGGVLSNSFVGISVHSNIENSIWLGNAYSFSIQKSSCANLDEFKQWLKANPVNVVYELAKPYYEEIIDVDLITYLDQTHISNNSNIPCNMVVKNTGYSTIIKPNTKYTVALDTNKSGTIGINLGGTKATTTNNVTTITTPSTLVDDSLRLTGKGIKASKVRLLEGDKTNWIPSFFEGMKSSFEDKLQEDGTYKMEILSNNKNLLGLDFYSNDHRVVSINGAIREINGNTFKVSNNNNTTMDCFAIHLYDLRKALKKSGVYTLSFDILERTGGYDAGIYLVRYLESSFTGGYIPLKYHSLGSYKTGDRVFIQFNYLNYSLEEVCFRLNVNSPNSSVKIGNIQIEEGTTTSNYIPQNSNKIQFSSIEPLRKWDRFVFKDNKLMIERGSLNFVVDNNRSWTYDTSISSPMYKCYIKDKIGTITQDLAMQNVLCDKLPIKQIYTTNDYYGLWIVNGSELRIRIQGFTSKEQYDNWLATNPLNITCVTTKEVTYEEIPSELQKIILEGYENGTLFLDTNIPPTVTTTYAGETPIVKATRLNKTEVLKNTDDINDNIVPYLMDMDFRVVCLQLEGGVENISMAKLFGGTYEMLQRDIQSKRYSVDEYKYRLEAYLSANKITQDEYEKLGGMLNE